MSLGHTPHVRAHVVAPQQNTHLEHNGNNKNQGNAEEWPQQ